MPDDKIKEVLVRAAMDAEFREHLLKDRAVALEGLGLSPTERNMLLAAAPEQLDAMIGQAQKDPAAKKGFDYKRAAVFSAVLGGGLLLSGAFCLPTLGHSARDIDAVHAKVLLQEVSAAEQRYFVQFNRYAGQAEIDRFLDKQKPGWQGATWARRYEHKVELVGDKYRIVVRHREEPEKHPAFVFETDGEVEPLK